MSNAVKQQDKETLTHVVGTFLIQAEGAFLNGAGIDKRREDRNTTIPKSYRDGIGNRVPYVSAQAWRRWLRNTIVRDNGWKPSELRAIDLTEKGTTNKIAGELNPVEFAEDDLFGYMRAAKGQGRQESDDDETIVMSDEELKRKEQSKKFTEFKSQLTTVKSGKKGKGKRLETIKEDERLKIALELAKQLEKELRVSSESEDDGERDPLSESLAGQARELAEKLEASKDMSGLNSIEQDLTRLVEEFNPGRVKALMRSSPFAASILVSLRRKGWDGLDKGFVHLKEGTPLPYNTEFYNTHFQGVFCLDYSRVGIFWNVGDRIELDEPFVKKYLEDKKLEDVTSLAPFSEITKDGKVGRIYRMGRHDETRRERARALLRSLAVLRGGAKQAQFGTDVAPKALILAGLDCGNPIFNHLFEDDDGRPCLKIKALTEIIQDYSDRISTPVYIGVRSGYLKNEDEVRKLHETKIARKVGSGQFDTQTSNGREVTIHVTTPIEAAQKMSASLI